MDAVRREGEGTLQSLSHDQSKRGTDITLVIFITTLAAVTTYCIAIIIAFKTEQQYQPI
jgi:hypothetical protein